MSFADGQWRWREPRILKFTGYAASTSLNDGDLARVQATVGAK